MTLYDVLGVTPAADDATVRRAYVSLARQHHPDREGGDADRMRAINHAWATLGDRAARARYDQALADLRPSRQPASDPASTTTSLDDLDERDAWDDRPLSGIVRLPGWLSMVPVGLFAGAVGLFVAGLVFASQPLLALALMALLLSTLFFLAAPFVALLVSRMGDSRHRVRR